MGMGKGRKKGDWVAVARGRAGRERDLARRPGTTGIHYPQQGDVGSATYRRTLDGQNGGRKTLSSEQRSRR